MICMEYCLISLEYQSLDVLFIESRRQEMFKFHFGVISLKVFFTDSEKLEWIGYAFL